jgi:hypothetical protein
MASPADQRILELLDRWLGSLELHSKYAALDDDAYWKLQAWVPHQRPTRWIIDLALQKTRALRDLVQERVNIGDAKFSEGLEAMAFLANLVGLQNIERFIPRADAPTDGAPSMAAEELTGTLKMPTISVRPGREPPATATQQVARTERKRAYRTPPRSKSAAEVARSQVIADAARLLQWGRDWHELAELIARMAGRPPLLEVRRILQDDKAAIDERAGLP